MHNIKNLSVIGIENIKEIKRFLLKIVEFHYDFKFIELVTGLIYFFNHV